MTSRAATVNGPLALDSLSRLVATFAARGLKPAVIVDGEDRADVCSYAQLAAQIERAALGLRASGVGDGDLVALWAPNSLDWITACFAVVRAGAAVIPLDHQAGADTVAALLARAAPKLLLTTAARRTELGTRTTIPCSTLESAEWRPQPAVGGTLPETRPEQLASLVYTSGTTGTPKGVPLTHANLLANVQALGNADLVGPAERVLLPLPLHHTYPFTVGLLTTLYRGATVVLPAGITGPEIARAAQRAQATALLAVPRLCSALWESVVAGARSRGKTAARAFFALLALSKALRRLGAPPIGRWLFPAVHRRLGGRLTLIGCGGAKLDPLLAADLDALGFLVLTGYGLTESSPVLTFNDRRHWRRGTEGRALAGVAVAIAAEPGQTSGEIRARGPNLFSGYWQDAAASAAAFTADGWFRTGDLGWVDDRGYLHIVGRSKELIVLADGKKLFPEELEKVYGAVPLIREIAILERDGALAALIVPDEEAVRERGALREAAMVRETLEDVAARLPPYQRIADYRLTRTALPRTQLGKLKRHLLAELYVGAAAREQPVPSAQLQRADALLLASERARAAWQWLATRYPDAALTLDMSPQLDLHVDSLGWVALTLEIEERFGVALTGDAVSRILSVRDLLREIEAAPLASALPRLAAAPYTPPGGASRAAGALLYGAIRLGMRTAFRIRVSGTQNLPAGDGYILTPNHTSYLDPLALAAALPWRRLRKLYWAGWVGVMHTSPLRRFLSRAAQVFPVDPDRDLASAIETARDLVRRGHSIVWFPEGRRSPTGELEPFQPGVGQLLNGTGAAAVPAVITGTFAAWPKHRRLPRLGQRLTVAFGPPLPGTRQRSPADAVTQLEQAARRLAAGAQTCDR